MYEDYVCIMFKSKYQTLNQIKTGNQILILQFVLRVISIEIKTAQFM